MAANARGRLNAGQEASPEHFCIEPAPDENRSVTTDFVLPGGAGDDIHDVSHPVEDKTPIHPRDGHDAFHPEQFHVMAADERSEPDIQLVHIDISGCFDCH